MFRGLNSQVHNLFGVVSGAFVIGSRGWLPIPVTIGQGTGRVRDSDIGQNNTFRFRVSAPDFDNDPDTGVGNTISNSPPDQESVGDMAASIPAQDGTAATACAIRGNTGDMIVPCAFNAIADSPNADVILVGGGDTGAMMDLGGVGFFRLGGTRADPDLSGAPFPSEARAQIEWPIDGEFQFLLGVAPNEVGYPGTSTWEFVLRINGADAIIATGINDTRFFTNNVDTASISAGDLVALSCRRTGGSDDINSGADIIVGFRPA